MTDDFLTEMAYFAFLADHNRPECRCKVDIRHQPATPENHQIRDATFISTDGRDCPIERHRHPFARPQ